jgi:hypothetical protein
MNLIVEEIRYINQSACIAVLHMQLLPLTFIDSILLHSLSQFSLVHGKKINCLPNLQIFVIDILRVFSKISV